MLGWRAGGLQRACWPRQPLPAACRCSMRRQLLLVRRMPCLLLRLLMLVRPCSRLGSGSLPLGLATPAASLFQVTQTPLPSSLPPSLPPFLPPSVPPDQGGEPAAGPRHRHAPRLWLCGVRGARGRGGSHGQHAQLGWVNACSSGGWTVGCQLAWWRAAWRAHAGVGSRAPHARRQAQPSALLPGLAAPAPRPAPAPSLLQSCAAACCLIEPPGVLRTAPPTRPPPRRAVRPRAARQLRAASQDQGRGQGLVQPGRVGRRRRLVRGVPRNRLAAAAAAAALWGLWGDVPQT